LDFGWRSASALRSVLGLDWASAPDGTISTAAPTATTLQDFLKALPGELKIAGAPS
jgi:hypothetical protein